MTVSIDNVSRTSFGGAFDLLRDNLRLPSIAYISLDQIKCPACRLKVHPEELIVRLMTSLRQFGFVSPILVDARLEVVDGEALFEAARRLKMRSVPTLRLDHLDGNQIRVLRLTPKNLAGIVKATGLEANAAASRGR